MKIPKNIGGAEKIRSLKNNSEMSMKKTSRIAVGNKQYIILQRNPKRSSIFRSSKNVVDTRTKSFLSNKNNL